MSALRADAGWPAGDPDAKRSPGGLHCAPGHGSTDLEVRIVPMRRRHLRGVLRIENEAVTRPWSLGLFMSELANRESRYYIVAKPPSPLSAPVLGYAGLLLIGPEAHITTVSVDARHRGRNVGTRLVLALVREAMARGCEALTLEVRARNEPAIKLYQRFGFVPAGVRKNYYADLGEDALVMWAHDVDQPGFAARIDSIADRLPSPAVTGSDLTEDPVQPDPVQPDPVQPAQSEGDR